jgi:peroxiredoxin
MGTMTAICLPGAVRTRGRSGILAPMAAESTMMPLGTPLPDFTLPTPDGTLHGPGDHPDAPALLVAFVCNHCPYVVHVGPELGRLAEGWMDQGVAVFAINANDAVEYPDDAPERMPAFAAANGWTFPYLVDESQDVARAYGAACTPDFFLFGPDRRLTYRGRFDASRPHSATPLTGEDLTTAITATLSGSPAPDPQLPSIGCSIKWK